MNPRRRGNQDIDVDLEIENLSGQGFGASQIESELDRSGKFAGRIPHVRTIRRRIAQIAEDTSGAWRMSEASGEEAAFVLPYIAHRAAISQGQSTQVTISEAKWIVRLRRIFPKMRLGMFSNLVREYNRREVEKRDTTTLDLLLGFAPWKDMDEGPLSDLIERMYPDPASAERQRILSLADTMMDWAKKEIDCRTEGKENGGS